MEFGDSQALLGQIVGSAILPLSKGTSTAWLQT
jgi:hypothetical protein